MSKYTYQLAALNNELIRIFFFPWKGRTNYEIKDIATENFTRNPLKPSSDTELKHPIKNHLEGSGEVHSNTSLGSVILSKWHKPSKN